MTEQCECANTDCQSIHAEYVNILSGKKYCKNCSLVAQLTANHYATVNHEKPVKLFNTIMQHNKMTIK